MSELLKIDVSAHTEKKNNLSYLSWAWAWSEVLKLDPQATWEAVEFNGLPVAILPDESAMVKVLVTIKGHTKSCWLPVMNHRNQAIKGPDAFQINTAIVRCLTKAISMHGLGLYIYAGEDLPEQDKPEPSKPIEVKARGGLSEVGRDIPKDRIEVLDAALEEVTFFFNNDDIDSAWDAYNQFFDDERLYLQGKMPRECKKALMAHFKDISQPKAA